MSGTSESVQGPGMFATTHWSMVLEAQGESPAAQEALEELLPHILATHLWICATPRRQRRRRRGDHPGVLRFIYADADERAILLTI